MKKLTFGYGTHALAVALLACVLVSAAPAVTGAAEEEAAVRENVRQMEAGWNAKSGALFAKPFAGDADYVVINGMHIRGREAIDKGHQRLFETRFKDSTLRLTVEQLRFLRPDVALVHVGAHNTIPGAGEWRAFITLVMVKEKGVWQIAAFQNTQVAEAGQR